MLISPQAAYAWVGSVWFSLFSSFVLAGLSVLASLGSVSSRGGLLAAAAGLCLSILLLVSAFVSLLRLAAWRVRLGFVILLGLVTSAQLGYFLELS